MTESTPLADLLRHQLRGLREERGETRDELARRARRFGLPWTRNVVAHIEDGSRSIPVEEFLLLPFVFERRLFELFDAETPYLQDSLSDDWIVLTDETRALPSALGAFLRGEWEGLRPSGFDTPEVRDVRSTARSIRERVKTTYRRLWPGSGTKEWTLAEAAAENHAEQKAAAKLGIDASYVSIAAFGLWGQSLTAERDRRLVDRAEADISPRSRQALRGHITRELLQELAPVLRRHFRRRKR